MGWSALALATLCVVGGWLIASWSPPPRSHVQAVTSVLDRQQMAVAQVSIEQIWPSALPFYAYGTQAMPYQARVTVVLVSGRRESGVLTCLDAPHDCIMTIPGLALFGQSIPDVMPEVKWYTALALWVKQFIPILAL